MRALDYVRISYIFALEINFTINQVVVLVSKL